ncbi:MAG: hypothetical protein AB8G05_21975 [Oligoflexales bacterium]
MIKYKKINELKVDMYMPKNKQKFLSAFILLTSFFVDSAIAQQNKNTSKGGKNKNTYTPSKTRSSNQIFNCNLDWSSPIGGNGFFTNNTEYYHFAQLAKENSTKKIEGPLRKYGLYKIDVKTLKSKLLMTLNLPETVSIIPHGDPLKALVVVVFNSNPNHCNRGAARYISFPIQKRQKSGGKLQVIQGKGDFQTVETTKLWNLYDFSRSNALEFDFGSFQVRTTFVKRNENEILLYFDSNRNRYYTWQPQQTSGKRGLVAYEGQGKMAGGVIFSSGDKLIQRKNLFGVAHYKKDSQSIDIIELSRWSGRAKRKVYTIYIPKMFNLDQTHLKTNFAKKIATVAASTRKQRKKIGNIAIFDYEKSWLLSSFSAPNNQYAAFESISPDGGYVAIEARNKVSENTETLSFYSIGTRKWNRIQIAK